MANVTSTHAQHVTLADRLQGLMARLREANARRALYVQTRGELQALGDRDLVDLGISRSDIESIARLAAYGH